MLSLSRCCRCSGQNMYGRHSLRSNQLNNHLNTKMVFLCVQIAISRRFVMRGSMSSRIFLRIEQWLNQGFCIQVISNAMVYARSFSLSFFSRARSQISLFKASKPSLERSTNPVSVQTQWTTHDDVSNEQHAKEENRTAKNAQRHFAQQWMRFWNFMYK